MILNEHRKQYLINAHMVQLTFCLLLSSQATSANAKD